ncbi:chloride channel protein [Arhodomonas aquaeolei]|uniref:chloride channel protein n=1 Tax=Arhodomonas aquaeolei TaxID=2369 RepID=UPI00216957A5|nr:chloride channel protein [Arhodomonas aquaeolei]MCS4503135.1 chloride channel protein [Arhodomonas aquaeolei]
MNDDTPAPSAGPATGQRPLSGAWMFVLALVVGAFGGFGSIVFKGAIAFFQNLFFLGRFDVHLQPDTHIDPSIWGWGVVFVPVVGAIIVTWIIRTLAPEARGHGVPEVMHAIYYHGGEMRPITVVAKAIASSVSIGTGGSVGREGPIIQIGSAFGSTLGRFRNMPARQRIVLVGAGAAAGIAATFNAPLGGLAFAVELMLISVTALNVALVASATVAATYIGRLYSGIGPSFEIPSVELFADHAIGSYQLLLCVPFGLLVGLAAAGFVHSIYWFEDRFESLFHNDYLRHMSGMFVLGLMMYAFLWYLDEYYIAGVGYATILDVLREVLTNPLLLLLLFAGKLIATGLTLGSGASGGVFSPSLFLGATLGASFADGLQWLVPGLQIDPVVFAIAGMAGMVGATTSAVVTAIVMIFEQTRDYSAMLPIITVVALAYVVRTRITAESIYTLKLARRGLGIPQGLQAAVSLSRKARRVMNPDFQVIDLDDLRQWQEEHVPGEGPRYTVVAKEGQLYGLAREDLRYVMRDRELSELVDTRFIVVPPTTRWPVLMRAIKEGGHEVVLVARGRASRDLLGVITPREIALTVRDAAELMD